MFKPRSGPDSRTSVRLSAASARLRVQSLLTYQRNRPTQKTLLLIRLTRFHPYESVTQVLTFPR